GRGGPCGGRLSLGSAVSFVFGGLALPADRNHRFVGSPAIDVPELLEIRPVEIGELLPGVGERGLELIRLRRLADGRAQRRHDLVRRAFRREYSDPKIVFDVKAE